MKKCNSLEEVRTEIDIIDDKLVDKAKGTNKSKYRLKSKVRTSRRMKSNNSTSKALKQKIAQRLLTLKTKVAAVRKKKAFIF